MVEIYNDYANTRLTGRDFRGIALENFVGRSLIVWRRNLLETRRRFSSNLFNSWEEVGPNLRTPTYTDKFLFSLFKELSSTKAGGNLSQEASHLLKVLNLGPTLSFLQIADAFYAGDMFKTFLNISAVANMTGKKIPEGWRAFHGTTAEYVKQSNWVHENSSYNVDEFTKNWGLERTKAERNFHTIQNMGRFSS